MKQKLLFILMLIGLAQFANGQAEITATTTPRGDGTYTDTVTDPDNHIMTITDYTLGMDHMTKYVKRKVVYKLDDQAQPISGFVYDAKGRLTMKSLYKRDALNRIAEEDDYTPNDQLLCKITYQFDANNRINGMQAVDAQGNPIALPSGHNAPGR